MCGKMLILENLMIEWRKVGWTFLNVSIQFNHEDPVMGIELVAIFINLIKLHLLAIQFHWDDINWHTYYNLWKSNFIKYGCIC